MITVKVLVTAASKHGATAEIAEEVGNALREALQDSGSGEVEVEVRSPEEVGSVEDYDAVVLGSAVYAGHWLESARELGQASRSCTLREADLAVLRRTGR